MKMRPGADSILKHCCEQAAEYGEMEMP